MRTLLTLIKRQIADNAACFAVAAGLSVALNVAVVSVVLAESLDNLSSYAVTLIIGTPIIICIGSFFLGVVQIHSDRISGVTETLLILPVGRRRILFVQFVIGVLVIITALAPLAVTGTILWKLLGPPEWLFHDWIADSVIGFFLTALTCHVLGLTTALRREIFLSMLLALASTLIIVLLIIARGFGWPLNVVLLPLIIASVIRLWRPRSLSLMTTVATGLIALVIWTVPLYFARHYCDSLLADVINATSRISPSGLLPPEIEIDPNNEDYSEVTASYSDSDYSVFEYILPPYWKPYSLLGPAYCLEPLGITDYAISRKQGERWSYWQSMYETPCYFIQIDQVGGQIVFRRAEADYWTERWNAGSTWEWNKLVEIYGGPKGVTENPDEGLGRFGDRSIYFSSIRPLVKPLPPCLVYDTDARCFFSIDFQNRIVSKGPRVQDSFTRPVSIGSSGGADSLLLRFDTPARMGAVQWSSNYLPVVDESGQVYILHPNTLELHGPIGHLPQPRTLFGRASSKPRDLLDYEVELLHVGPPERYMLPNNVDFDLLGKMIEKDAVAAAGRIEEHPAVITASLSRQGTWTAVAVFDKEGNKIKSATSQAGFFDKPWGAVLTATKCLFESLHPPVLTFASFFTAYSFEARATHRALFLMPNSFAAMVRDHDGNIFVTLAILLLVMLPGLAIAGWLGHRVTRDAAAIGLSLGPRRFWLAATILFGLAGYVTYRLTRPKVTLVTCVNCGKGRRPDMETCHHCGEKWDVPEITPPAWRVLEKRPEQDRQGCTEAD